MTIRAIQALLWIALPGCALSLLLSLGERDWFLCFTGQTGDWDAAELRQIVLEVVTAPFASLLTWLLHFGGGIGFALAWHLAPDRTTRLWLAASAVIFACIVLISFLPLTGQHDCDRKGPDSFLWLFFLTPLGFSLPLLTLFIRKPR